MKFECGGPVRNGISRIVILLLIVLAGAAACSELPDPSSGTPGPGPVPVYDWTIQHTETLADINDIFFFNNSSGWAVGGQQVVFSTVDGGQTWPLTPIGPLERDLRGVFIVSEGSGWIAGGMEGEEPDGYLFHSVNGGAYAEPRTMTEKPLHSIFFLDEFTGWSGGEDGVILHTEDGATWLEGTIGETVTVFDLHFLTPAVGWAATSGGLYATGDGSTWTKQHDTPLRSVFMLDQQHGWACGDGNVVLTGKAGPDEELAWTQGTINTEAAGIIWADLFFVDEDSGWI